MKLSNILDQIECERFIGDSTVEISEMIPLDSENKRVDILCWVKLSNKEKLVTLSYGTIICEEGSLPATLGEHCNYIVSKNPRRTFQETLRVLYFLDSVEWKIDKTATIENNTKIHSKVKICANVVIMDNVKIGEGTVVGPNTVINKNTQIGSNCTIGANNTIGGVGFGYEKNDKGDWEQIPHVGNVVIENNVDIGNNSTIDRAVLGSTILKENCKVDNLVHIAHGVVIGRNSMVIANSMIAGSVTIGDNTWIAPSASILNQKKIGNDVVVGLGAVVLKNVENGAVIIGNPGKPLAKK